MTKEPDRARLEALGLGPPGQERAHRRQQAQARRDLDPLALELADARGQGLGEGLADALRQPPGRDQVLLAAQPAAGLTVEAGRIDGHALDSKGEELVRGPDDEAGLGGDRLELGAVPAQLVGSRAPVTALGDQRSALTRGELARGGGDQRGLDGGLDRGRRQAAEHAGEAGECP
ncbi:hypothetical protein ENSA5_20640 [Enhygromyxa salina]|uniref:Uncharacterized protein n=1 Tax=Enhygromyxa salina TaxID=215803 RepID=A0A2S9YCG7_9BACT|nr:hypothetical protein ENSA5_20640 [Enhygromyxa salina]